jgi:predicted nucleotidyltransferase component of viral defense system
MGRLRKRLAMERLLMRLQADKSSRWLLKGGVALELRLQEGARSTIDLDLSLDFELTEQAPAPAEIFERLANAMSKTGPDFFRFEFPGTIGTDLEIEGLQVYRFSVAASLAGRLFDRFKLDVVVEPAFSARSETVMGSGLLAFAGIERESFQVVALERHFAEKIHAYSRPREVRTRVKDLVDILLISQIGLPARAVVKEEIDRVFEERKTHSVPASLPLAPIEWKAPFEAEARRTGLGPITLAGGMERANRIWSQLQT